MKRHIAAWAAAVAFVVSGYGLAGCGPREDTRDTGRQVCVKDGERVPCK